MDAIYLGTVSASNYAAPHYHAQSHLVFAGSEEEAERKVKGYGEDAFPEGAFNFLVGVKRLTDKTLLNIIDVCREQGLI